MYLNPHVFISFSVKLNFALIVHTNSSPSLHNDEIGSSEICLSSSVSYAMATPRVGFTLDSCQGGSTMITSNKRPVSYWCLYANLWKSNVITSTLMGTLSIGTTNSFYLG